LKERKEIVGGRKLFAKLTRNCNFFLYNCLNSLPVQLQ
jgi:hypothetical protein